MEKRGREGGMGQGMGEGSDEKTISQMRDCPQSPQVVGRGDEKGGEREGTRGLTGRRTRFPAGVAVRDSPSKTAFANAANFSSKIARCPFFRNQHHHVQMD